MSDNMDEPESGQCCVCFRQDAYFECGVCFNAFCDLHYPGHEESCEEAADEYEYE